ncbi:HIT domain-containing protein [Candidatus Woesearchaeota archaeon]|nr:HIT domain-containing protein [Candidatus Woesearchaeota archaeon]
MDQHGNSGAHGDAGEMGSMSQPELEELQRKNCVFCHIASGKVPARKVYEDDECVAVLDINPANQGHVLLMPKEHYTVMFQVPEDALGHIFIIAKGLSQAGLKAFQSSGTTIFAANGIAAGQRAPHFMLHVIPRTQADNVGIYIPARAFPEKEAAQLAAALSAALGGKKEVKKEAGGEVAIAEKNSRHVTDAKKKDEAVAAAEIAKDEKASDAKAEGKKAKEADLDSLTDFLTKGSGKGSSKGGGR